MLHKNSLTPFMVSDTPNMTSEHYHLLEERFLPGTNQPILVPPHLPQHFLLAIRDRYVAYNSFLVDIICQRITEGEPLTKICQTYGFPSYSTFCKWRREHPEINELLDQARRDRAEFMRDQAMEVALGATERTVDSSTLKHAAFKWGAQVDDKERYSPTSKVQMENSQPLQIIVNTGIMTADSPKQTYEQRLKDAKPVTQVQTTAPVAQSSSSVDPGTSPSSKSQPKVR
mgnify:CR=1 FL=1